MRKAGTSVFGARPRSSAVRSRRVWRSLASGGYGLASRLGCGVIETPGMVVSCGAAVAVSAGLSTVSGAEVAVGAEVALPLQPARSSKKEAAIEENSRANVMERRLAFRGLFTACP